MVLITNTGPIVAFGITRDSNGNVTQYNEERGTSLYDLGTGFADPRIPYAYKPGSAVGTPIVGFFDNLGLVDYIPATASSNALVSNGSSTVNGSLTLTATGAGVIATTIVAPESGQTVTVFALDSTAATLPMGQAGTVQLWNPAAGAGRCISVTASSSGSTGATVSIAGRDMYGIKMTELVTLSTATAPAVGTSQKAFKYISSITASTTFTAGFIVGTTDTFGFPLKLAYCGVSTVVNLLASSFSSAVAVALSSASTTLASTATTSNSTNGDVRGTYASTTASNGTLRFQIVQNMTANQMAAITSTNHASVFGIPQFSSV
jgi:hypothetical protein